MRVAVLSLLLVSALSVSFESAEPEALIELQERVDEGPVGIIKAASGLCLNAHDRTNAGSEVHVWSCDSGSRNSLWDYDSESGEISNHFGICLDAHGPSVPGARVKMGQCDRNSPAQRWDIDAGTKQIKNRDGICLYASEETEGRVQLLECNTASSDQHWTFVAMRSQSGQGPPIDCKWTPWSQFGACSEECGVGEQTRARVVVTKPQNGGITCPELQETRKCNSQPCPEPRACEVGAWSPYSQCSKQCGGGTQTRAREVVVAAMNGGAACPQLAESRVCNPEVCPERADNQKPILCVLSGWSPLSPCSKACGGGYKHKSRSVQVQPQFGAAPCAALLHTEKCNTQSCPEAQDCKASAWGSFSTCSAECAGGEQQRSRSIVLQPQNGGLECPLLHESRRCNTQGCENKLIAAAAAAAVRDAAHEAHEKEQQVAQQAEKQVAQQVQKKQEEKTPAGVQEKKSSSDQKSELDAAPHLG